MSSLGPSGARDERRERTAELFARRDRSAAEERPAIEDEVVLVNMAMARSAVRRFRGRGVPDDDLEQVAYVGLVKAVRAFRPDRGHDFLSYAVPTIRGEVRRYFRDRGWMVRPARWVQETQVKVLASEPELYQQLGRAPRPSEIADHLGIDVGQVVEALGAVGCFWPGSLEAPVRAGQEATVADTLGVDDDGYRDAEVRAMLDPLLAGLSDRERVVIDLRFVRGLTQAEIGAEIGISQVQVSRLLARVLRRLRRELESTEAAA